MTNTTSLALLMGTILAVPVGFARAAQDAAPPSDDADQILSLEEIIVTAQRQEQSLQETPVSVAGFTGKMLADIGVANVGNLALQSPSLSVKTDFGAANPNIYIRGVGIGDFNANVTGAVGVYNDEVYLSAAAGQLMQFYDVEQVEVLRGPQGTLYGRNTTGGAVKIASRKPTEELTIDALAEYGRFDEKRGQIGIGFGIVPGLLKARISGSMHKRDGYIRNTYDGSGPNPLNAPARVADIDSAAARIQFDFTPTDTSSFLFNFHYGESDTSGVRFNHRGLFDPEAFASGSIVLCVDTRLDKGECVDALGYAEGDADPDTVSYNNPVREQLKAWGTNLQASIGIGDYNFTSITAYENTKRESVFDGEESPLNLLDAFHNPRYKQFSQEIRLSSPVDKKLRWTVGGFYFEEDLDFTGTFDVFREVRDDIAAAAAALNLGPPLVLGFNPTGGPDLAAQLGNPIFAFPTLSSLYEYDQKVESWALFGQVYYDLTEKLTATLGLRYSEEDRTFNYRSSLQEPFLPAEGILLAETNDELENNKTSFSDLSFRIALEYRANDDLFFYTSVSRGAKSGGFNGAFLLAQAQTAPFEDEQVTAYELGMKSEWLDNRFRLNLTGFYYDYKDLQLFTLQSTAGVPQQILSNAPAAEIYGAELELLFRPTSNLQIGTGLSFLETEITESFIGPSGADLKGNDLAYSPSFSINGNIEYVVPLNDDAELALQADTAFTKGSFTETNNISRLKSEDGFLVNTRVAYRQGNWEFSLYGRNILDKRFIQYSADLSDFGLDRVQYNEPATYGVGVRFLY
jgi:iron complex outermembrane receptor protein